MFTVFSDFDLYRLRMTIDLRRNHSGFALNKLDPHTKYNGHSTFHTMTCVDPKYPMHSAVNNMILVVTDVGLTIKFIQTVRFKLSGLHSF